MFHKIFFIHSIIILSFFCFHCGNNIPFLNEVTLKRPTGLVVTSLDGLKFEVSYTIQNAESTFDGYHLYISRSTISEGEIYSLTPLSLNGSSPTFHHSKDELSSIPQKREISHFTDGVSRFEEGVNYFFRLVAHSRFNILSRPSNEVQNIARK